MSKNIQVARNYLLAYEAKDLAAIAKMISPDVWLQDWNISGQGDSFFLGETRKNFEAAQQIKIEILSMQESADLVSAQLQITVNGHELLEVVDVISFDSGNLIRGVRAYKG
ncbi:MAG: hypothetical protein RL600_171 [Actinomycetota bacterium]